MGEFSRLMNSPGEMWAVIFRFNHLNLKQIHGRFKTSLLRDLKYIGKYKGSDEYDAAARIIARAYINIVPPEYKEYAGSGYKSFTSPLQSAISSPGDIDIGKLSAILTKFFDELKKAKF
jgi:hypothetical protein